MHVSTVLRTYAQHTRAPCGRGDAARVPWQNAAAVLCVLSLATGCVQDPNGGWRPAIGSPKTTPPAAPAAAGATAQNAPVDNRFDSLFNDAQRHADVQQQLADAQRKRMEQLTQLERDIEKERESLKTKRLELERRDRERDAMLARSERERQDKIGDYKNRAGQLDTDNKELQTLLADSQQQIRQLRGQVSTLQQQIQEAAGQLADSEQSRKLKEDQIQALRASQERRTQGGITANNSLKRSLTAVQVPGLDVWQDGDLVRMTLPSDKIFLPGTATLHQGASRYLDLVASTVQRYYPNQILAIEAHVDAVQASKTKQWRGSHQLAVAQSMAVFEQLTYRHGLPPKQMFVATHGHNQPLASNETESGRARNRRVDVVVYPERPR